MSSLETKESKIFEEWDKRYPHEIIVRDGIVDFETYKNEKIKIVFVLKDTNKYNDKLGFKRFLCKGAIGGGHTWNNVVRWTAAILDGQIKWDSLNFISENERKPYLKKIAVVNLKKSSGEGTSIVSEISKFSNDNKVILTEQINLYNPDIIICGGTGYFYKEVLLENKFKWKELNKGLSYISTNDRHIFSYYHPADRKNKQKLFDDFRNAVKEKLNI